MSNRPTVHLKELLKLAKIHQAPRPEKRPKEITFHDDVRVDDYFWLREKQNPEVIAHLEAENHYTQTVLAPLTELREDLFAEMKARLKEDDSSVPYKHGEYYYYSRVSAGQQYAVHCRKHQTLEAPEEIILDGNELAKGHDYFRLGAMDISHDHQWLAYGVDLDGSEKYTLFFKNLNTGALSQESIPGAGTTLIWANDSQTVFYTLLDAQERPDRMLRHQVGANPDQDTLVYKEQDPQFFVFGSKSRSGKYIFIDVEGKITSETWFLDADQPTGEFRVVSARRRGIEYSVSHHDHRFFIVVNDTVRNFRLVETPVASPDENNWREIKSGSETLFIEGCETFRSYLVLHVRERGLEQMRIIDLETGAEHPIAFPEPTYDLHGQVNAEFDTDIFRFSYSSLVTPTSVIDYNMRTRTQEVKKRQEIPSGYNPSLYRSERLYAKAHDGTEIPISLVYRLDETGEFKRDGTRPLYLYGYGSYGLSSNAAFSTVRLSLLDRGFVFAMAHIRGGSELGRGWYEEGKFLKKINTFVDFTAVAEHLIRDGYTHKAGIAAAGGSAGGMLVGAAINTRPDLFHAAIAHVPFVDVVNTMLDDTLPLTTLEYEEWGNPNDPVYYHYMKSYSPYDNVKAQAYPHLLVTSGLNDPRVTYWEPTKWVAKLRDMNTSENLILHHIHMGAGHGGPSGRYETLREHAMEYAFLLGVFGKA